MCADSYQNSSDQTGHLGAPFFLGLNQGGLMPAPSQKGARRMLTSVHGNEMEFSMAARGTYGRVLHLQRGRIR